jgi:hypothetical protein
MESKPNWLFGKQCDLFIDDLMSGQEKARPVFLWQIYKRLLEIGVPVEVFRNNWAEILERHLGP